MIFVRSQEGNFFSCPEKHIDHILTNDKHGFLESQKFKTGFVVFHHLVYTVVKTDSVKLPSERITYMFYKILTKQEQPCFSFSLALTQHFSKVNKESSCVRH